MTLDEGVKLIQGVGFPAAVAFFVLWRLEGALNRLRDELVALRAEFWLSRHGQDTPRPPGRPS